MTLCVLSCVESCRLRPGQTDRNRQLSFVESAQIAHNSRNNLFNVIKILYTLFLKTSTVLYIDCVASPEIYNSRVHSVVDPHQLKHVYIMNFSFVSPKSFDRTYFKSISVMCVNKRLKVSGESGLSLLERHGGQMCIVFINKINQN